MMFPLISYFVGALDLAQGGFLSKVTWLADQVTESTFKADSKTWVVPSLPLHFHLVLVILFHSVIPQRGNKRLLDTGPLLWLY